MRDAGNFARPRSCSIYNSLALPLGDGFRFENSSNYKNQGGLSANPALCEPLVIAQTSPGENEADGRSREAFCTVNQVFDFTHRALRVGIQAEVPTLGESDKDLHELFLFDDPFRRTQLNTGSRTSMSPECPVRTLDVTTGVLLQMVLLPRWD